MSGRAQSRRSGDVLERLTTIGGGGVTPPPPGPRFHGGGWNLQKGIFIWAIFGVHTFGVQTLPPSSPLDCGPLQWIALSESGMRSGSCGLSQNLTAWPPLFSYIPRAKGRALGSRHRRRVHRDGPRAHQQEAQMRLCGCIVAGHNAFICKAAGQAHVTDTVAAVPRTAHPPCALCECTAGRGRAPGAPCVTTAASRASAGAAPLLR